MNKKEHIPVIIANGSFPTHPLPLSLIDAADYIVCCDGAANNAIAHNIIPDAIVGDCDSISEENKKKFQHILHKNPDQETNDLTKAVRFCMEKGVKQVKIVGATGKRDDHTIGNISLLVEYLNHIDVEMITDYGIFKPIHQTSVFNSFAGQQISIFCIDRQPLTSEGLRYPINNQILENWWQGTLNECISNRFKIITNGRCIIFSAFE